MPSATRWTYLNHCALGLAALLTLIVCGCQPPAAPVTETPRQATQVASLAALGAQPGAAIVAQGQLEPAGGVLAIIAPPGDRLEELLVGIDSEVTAGAPLGRLASQAARETELSVAEIKLAEARKSKAAQAKVASANLMVAEIGLKQAQLRVQQARDEFERAQASGGKLDLLDQQVSLAETKLAQLRSASSDPTAGRLVTANSLDQQQLAVNQARSDLKAARAEAEAAIEAGELAVKAAEQELEAARLGIESADASSSLESLAEQIKLLRLQVQASKLLSPIDGTVVAVHAQPGEPTTGLPLLQVADLTRMICRAEVNVAQLPQIEPGARASITSPAIEGSFSGQVRSISRLIGSPSLPSPNPLAQVDYRTTEVLIEIDPEDARRATGLINLQVDVAIVRPEN